MDAGRNGASFTMLGVLLAIVLVMAGTLFVLLFRGPIAHHDATLRLEGPDPLTCPEGSRAPVCYSAQVLNVGTAPAMILCTVNGGVGTAATFSNKLPQYLTATPLQPGDALPLTIRVNADTDVVTEPSLACSVTS
jgi:hypothetical protein